MTVDPSEGAVLGTEACRDASTQAANDGQFREEIWRYAHTPAGPMNVVVAIPVHASKCHRLPVLFAFHGRGEALKGPERGARGWIDDYAIGDAMLRLRRPPVRAQDLQYISDPRRTRQMNAALELDPYDGLILVLPYTPDIASNQQPFSSAQPLGEFVVSELIPRVFRETPAMGSAQTTGIDGVSLGGRASLLIGLMHADKFGAVGGMQAAFGSEEAPKLAVLASEAITKNARLRVRLLTSDEDPYRQATQALSRAMDRAGVRHEFVVIPGPHSYGFNRGPGAYELLWFHDRVLRGRSSLEELVGDAGR